jgi:protein-S-isoprenylcysteine O-methyltransferase Ste14
MSGLAVRAVVSVFVLVGLLGAVIFASAGTLDYWQAWVYLTILLIVSLLTTIYLLRNDPELLRRRLHGGPTAEKRPAQRIIMTFTTLGFIALLVVPALDRRTGWSNVPPLVVLTGNILFVVGYYFIYRVFRENSFTSATIEIATDHKVIDTGPYSIVRHPMYASALLYLAGTPLALGSFWGLVPFAAVIPFLIWRLFDEETMLERELQGYSDYKKRVMYRLLPGVW